MSVLRRDGKSDAFLGYVNDPAPDLAADGEDEDTSVSCPRLCAEVAQGIVRLHLAVAHTVMA